MFKNKYSIEKMTFITLTDGGANHGGSDNIKVEDGKLGIKSGRYDDTLVLKVGKKKAYKLLENKRRHQFSESECGMYSLYFIIQMLKGVTFKKFTSKRVKDSYMMKLRKIYFNQ